MSVQEWPVEVRPAGVSFAVAAGETVFAAAARAGLRWPTVCGGNGNCGTCLSEVVEGIENCSPRQALEVETLTNVLRQHGHPARRLVCQLRITGPVTVVRRGVRALEPVQSPQERGQAWSRR